MNIWKSYIWTADKDVTMKAIFAIMNTTWAVVKIRPEKKIQACSGFKSRTGLNFFRPYFHYYSSSVHYCEDRFHTHVNNFCRRWVSWEMIFVVPLSNTENLTRPWLNNSNRSHVCRWVATYFLFMKFKPKWIIDVVALRAFSHYFYEAGNLKE